MDEVYSPYDGAVERGIDLGRDEMCVEIAKNLLSEDVSDEFVSRNTGLDLETVRQLRAEL